MSAVDDDRYLRYVVASLAMFRSVWERMGQFVSRTRNFPVEILDDFPDLTHEDIRACLAFAADRERRLAVLPQYEVVL